MPILHNSCKFLDHFGVLNVHLGREAPQGEVVVHEEHDERTPSTGDLQATAHPGRQDGGTVGMFTNIFSPPGIVENQGDVESVGIGMLKKKIPVEGPLGGFVIHEGIELIDAAKSVFIRSVTMKKLVLNQAIKRSKFREIASENTTSMHEAETGCNLPLSFEDDPKSDPIFTAETEGVVDEVPVRFDEFSERWRRADVVLLTV